MNYNGIDLYTYIKRFTESLPASRGADTVPLCLLSFPKFSLFNREKVTIRIPNPNSVTNLTLNRYH